MLFVFALLFLRISREAHSPVNGVRAQLRRYTSCLSDTLRRKAGAWDSRHHSTRVAGWSRHNVAYYYKYKMQCGKITNNIHKFSNSLIWSGSIRIYRWRLIVCQKYFRIAQIIHLILRCVDINQNKIKKNPFGLARTKGMRCACVHATNDNNMK